MAVIEAVLRDVHQDWETHERRWSGRLLSDGSERADDSESTCAQKTAHILHSYLRREQGWQRGTERE